MSNSSADCLFCEKLATLDKLPDTEVVWQFPGSVAFLGPWQYYRGYCILASRTHASELSQLPDEARRQYLEEMCTLARVIEECFQPVKLNYELLGNLVPHLHWHIIPRYADDLDIAHPIWITIEKIKKVPKEREWMQEGLVDQRVTMKKLREKLKKLTGKTGQSKSKKE